MIDAEIRSSVQRIKLKFVEGKADQPDIRYGIVTGAFPDGEGKVISYSVDVINADGGRTPVMGIPSEGTNYGIGQPVQVAREGGSALGQFRLSQGISGYGSQPPTLFGGLTTFTPTQLIDGLGFHIPAGDGCFIVGGTLIREPTPHVTGTRVRICANGIKGLSDDGSGDQLAFMLATEDHVFYENNVPYDIGAGDAQFGYRSKGHLLVDSSAGTFSWNVADRTLFESSVVDDLGITRMEDLLLLSDTYVGEGITLGKDYSDAYTIQLTNKYNQSLILMRAGFTDDPMRAYLRIGPPPPLPNIIATSLEDGTPVIYMHGGVIVDATVVSSKLSIAELSDITSSLGVVSLGRAEFLQPGTSFIHWLNNGNATGMVLGYNDQTQRGSLLGLNAGVVQTSINSDGTLTAINATITGTLTATVGTIGGWTIAAAELSQGNVKLQSTAERLLLGAATAPLTGIGIFVGKDGTDYEFRAGDPASKYVHWDGSILTVKGAVHETFAAGSEIGIMGWTYDGAFTASDVDTVAWALGTLRLTNGVTYSIVAGNTGNMVARTWIYLDIAVSTTVFQTTATYSTAVGTGKILVAVAVNSATGTEASFLVFGGGGYTNIHGNDIVAGSIVGDNIAANTITANKMNVTQLSAIVADLGSVTAGQIVVGSTNKLWLNEGADGILAIGGSTKASAPFRVTAAGALTATGATITGAITATSGAIAGWTIAAAELSQGNVKLQSTAERLLLGAATAPLTGIGIFLGKDGTDYEFRAGDPASKYVHWDGSILTVKGAVHETFAAGSEIGIMGWSQSCVFSATDADTVHWTSGSVVLTNGATYAIAAGDTIATMIARTYIYLDIAVSTTAYQTTTTYSTAVGTGKILIGIAVPSATGTEASFLIFGGAGYHNIHGNNIVAESITAGEIAANTITANKLSVTQLSAIVANMGTLTSGEIKVGSGTVGVDFTGLRLYNVSGSLYALRGYNADVLQTELATDGKIKWAAGKGILEAAGMKYYVDANNYFYLAHSDDASARMVLTNNTQDVTFYIRNSYASAGATGLSVITSPTAGNVSIYGYSLGGVGVYADNNDTTNDYAALVANRFGIGGGAISTVFRIASTGANTPTNGFGSRTLYQLESSTTIGQDAAAMDVLWTTATHASRTAAIKWSLVNSAAALAEFMRLTPVGLRIGTAGAPSATLHIGLGRSALTAGLTGSVYVNTGLTTDYGGIIFQGVSVSDMFFGRGASTDDLIISTANTASPVELVRFKQTGMVLIGDNANANMTKGLTINQGAADNEILAFKSSDVTQPFTAIAEADTFGDFLKGNATLGSLFVRGFAKTGYSAGLHLYGFVDDGNTTKTAAASAPVVIAGLEHDGAGGAGVMSADANVLVVRNGFSAAVLIVDEDGDLLIDGASSAFDAYDDALLVRALDRTISPQSIIDSQFDAWVTYNRADLERANIIGKGGNFVNLRTLSKLHSGAIWQLYTEMQSLRQEVSELKARYN